VGSEYQETRMIYDTMSQWTSILDTKTIGASILSNYEHSESRTSSEIFEDSVSRTPLDLSVKLG